MKSTLFQHLSAILLFSAGNAFPLAEPQDTASSESTVNATVPNYNSVENVIITGITAAREWSPRRVLRMFRINCQPLGRVSSSSAEDFTKIHLELFVPASGNMAATHNYNPRWSNWVTPRELSYDFAGSPNQPWTWKDHGIPLSEAFDKVKAAGYPGPYSLILMVFEKMDPFDMTRGTETSYVFRIPGNGNRYVIFGAKTQRVRYIPALGGDQQQLYTMLEAVDGNNTFATS